MRRAGAAALTIAGLAVALGVLAAGAAGDAPGEPLVSVVVRLDDPPAAAYTGGRPGLPATSPRATGATRLDARQPAVQSYRAHLAARQASFEAAARAAVPAARVLHRYQMVLGGVAMLVPAGQVGALARLPGVVAVYPDELRRLHTERSPKFIGATRLWRDVGGQARAGEGVIVGVIDTGIWPEHPAFADPDPTGRAYPPPPPPARGCAFPGGAGAGAPFACNGKLIGAYRFMAAYDACAAQPINPCAAPPGDFASARDGDGHGTHTASTAAGNGRVEASIFGVERGLVSGIAPRAHVVAYKVCGADGCFVSDSVAAVEQALLDGVDVINFSIGGGFLPFVDPVELAFLDAYAAGVFVAASAGNDGPALDTVEHRGGWVTTVAASTEARRFQGEVRVMSSGRGTRTFRGASITGGILTPAPVVSAADHGDPLCLDETPAPGAYAGRIVVCRRGVNDRIAKSFNVALGGAVGMVLYNPTVEGLATDNHVIPTVHLEAGDGAALTAFLSLGGAVTGTLGAAKARADRGDVVAAFSSRGGRSASGIGKPDLAAPGVQILAGTTEAPYDPASPAGERFQAIQGTSMASPHVAGAAALLRALHPAWTPGQIKSALMTTAATRKLRDHEGDAVTPFDAGAGRIDLTRAGDPGITFAAEAADFTEHASDPWHVNAPGIFLPAAAPNTVSVVRTARSEVPETRVWTLTVRTVTGLTIAAPKSITVPGFGTATFTVTVGKSGVPGGLTRHATIELRSGPYRAHLPVSATR